MTVIEEKYYLGIDLGTSSAKAILRSLDGKTLKARCSYPAEGPDGWTGAVKELASQLKRSILGEIAAVSFSSQVGTYLINGKDVIPWHSSIGRDELDQITSAVNDDGFIREIGMRHPDLISYPLPRLLYVQRNYGSDADVLMPKDHVIRELTGNTVTDVFTMRGIAHPEKMTYADGIMRRLGIKASLPELKTPTSLAGHVSSDGEEKFGIKKGTPVYLGCNDFFAGLLGMGVTNIGDAFDLSGSSEHIGRITDGLDENGFVSGRYFVGHATYGGTKSSGASCELAIRSFGLDGIDPYKLLTKKPPIFLPYLSGERAPIFDENARGVYFGLNSTTDNEAMAYSTLEGVVFSLFHIAEGMKMPRPSRLICGGGSAKDPIMNLLRASVFNCEAVCASENDTSALGACMLAMIGDGVYADIDSAASHCVSYLPEAKPDEVLSELLRKRFEIYKDLYSDLKNSFNKFSNI